MTAATTTTEFSVGDYVAYEDSEREHFDAGQVSAINGDTITVTNRWGNSWRGTPDSLTRARVTGDIQVGDRVRLVRTENPEVRGQEATVTRVVTDPDATFPGLATLIHTDRDGGAGRFIWRFDKVEREPERQVITEAIAEPVVGVSPEVRAAHEQALADLRRNIEREKEELRRFKDQVRVYTMGMKREEGWCGEAERALGELDISPTKTYRVTGTLYFTATIEAPDNDFWDNDQVELDTYYGGTLSSFLRSNSDLVEISTQQIEHIEDLDITEED